MKISWATSVSIVEISSRIHLEIIYEVVETLELVPAGRFNFPQLGKSAFHKSIPALKTYELHIQARFRTHPQTSRTWAGYYTKRQDFQMPSLEGGEALLQAERKPFIHSPQFDPRRQEQNQGFEWQTSYL